MACTKAQLLALISRIEKDMSKCRDIDCAIHVIEEYRQIIEENAMTEALREILRP